MNQNTNNLIVVDFDSTILNINYVRYAIQNQEKFITQEFFHGTAQQAVKTSDLNNLYDEFPITFRRTKQDEDLTGKLIFNRVGKFGIDIHA